ncbi:MULTISPECIES: carbohydrate ABC transporter permease [unclassified Microbacterium]|uniref:carbohydrate ABC transporter permease n=1 Tax=unclassified Microbacterium TaxID=2609290 RepID=UPI0004243C1C|nr:MULTISPECIES: sugar ABC transporter permease [unclassified Microbacterium]PQZ52263.1 sugar ABC transporter permease [Microbacterium sp. MYb43]PQZ73485.1 sugar ABC transporter permease [Microbacterium sp. MYb40]PRB16121.1 sugar ABC transporter permease [Microbacterium sp. MYb54]PRB22562.1 sugar ABC transporter permease [Microbacterium sp. MYb50]PRB60738.1 sugar ABC transporter permease [Microbacterium sp. MYb24]
MNATVFFQWIGTLPPILQAVVVVIAFAVVVAIILFLVDVAPRKGAVYTWVRLAMCLLIPLAVMFFFSSYYWAMGVAVIVGALFFYLDYRSRDGAGYLIQLVAFMAPALLLLLVGLILPSIQTMYSSFLSSSGKDFVGFANYLWIFTQSDGITSVVNSIIWVLLVPTVSTIVGLAYAVFIDRTRGEKIYKVLVFMPMAISFVGAGIIWRFMYEYRGADFPQIGLLNQILVWFGGEPQQWLLNEPWNNLFLIVVLIWVQTGFAMVVLSASIKGVPQELLEAAELDGANAWQRFLSVTIPSIRPALIVVLTTISIASLKVFDIVRTMTAGNYGTSTLANEMYTQFSKFEAGRSAALSVILFVLVLPIVIYNARQIKKQREVR